MIVMMPISLTPISNVIKLCCKRPENDVWFHLRPNVNDGARYIKNVLKAFQASVSCFYTCSFKASEFTGKKNIILAGGNWSLKFKNLNIPIECFYSLLKPFVARIKNVIIIWRTVKRRSTFSTTQKDYYYKYSRFQLYQYPAISFSFSFMGRLS